MLNNMSIKNSILAFSSLFSVWFLLVALLEVFKEHTSSWTIGMCIVGASAILGLGYYMAQSIQAGLQKWTSGLLTNSHKFIKISREVSDAATTLSSSSNQQAAALQQTAASIEEVNAMVGRTSENATKSNEVSISSYQAALNGKKVVDTMIQMIEAVTQGNDDIMRQIETSNRQISEIVSVISEIGNKTQVINDIVFQTRLLSFNASVEAARAGEHGKGFAVVAGEVGNLAQMSGNAAKEISDMLEGSIEKVQGIVQDTRGKVEKLATVSKERVVNSSETARRCGAMLDDIVSELAEVKGRVGEIERSGD